MAGLGRKNLDYSLCVWFNPNLLNREQKPSILQFIKREQRMVAATDCQLCPRRAINAESSGAKVVAFVLYIVLSATRAASCSEELLGGRELRG